MPTRADSTAVLICGVPVKAAAAKAASATGLGSLMAIHFRPGPIGAPEDLEGEDPRLKQLFHLAMVALSLPMGEAETAALLAAVGGFIEDYGPLLPRAESSA